MGLVGRVDLFQHLARAAAQQKLGRVGGGAVVETEADTLAQALQTLQAQGAHLARVVDEGGAVVGVATLEDVIEVLVGEIRDAAHAEGH